MFNNNYNNNNNRSDGGNGNSDNLIEFIRLSLMYRLSCYLSITRAHKNKNTTEKLESRKTEHKTKNKNIVTLKNNNMNEAISKKET